MIWVCINKVASEGEAANRMGVQRVGGREERDTQVMEDEGRGASEGDSRASQWVYFTNYAQVQA